MAVAVVYRPPAVTAEKYKDLWASGSPMPDAQGLLFHAGVGEGDDFFTISVWESRETYDAFASGVKEAGAAPGLEGDRPRYFRSITQSTTGFPPNQIRGRPPALGPGGEPNPMRLRCATRPHSGYAAFPPPPSGRFGHGLERLPP